MSKPFTWDFRGRKSIRLKQYDYSTPGCYFITMCTAGKMCLFGEVINGRMEMNALGEIVFREWQRVAIIRENVRLDAFIVMPNHMHAIMWIEPKNRRRDDALRRPESFPHNAGATQSVAPTCNVVPISNIVRGPKTQSIGSIIGVFKSQATKLIRSSGYAEPVWQQGYWDRIIRDEEALWAIRDYIRNNPMNWDRDPENIR